MLAGGIYAALYAHYQLSKRLPAQYLNTEVVITGKVVDLPSRDDRRLRFVVALSSITLPEQKLAHAVNSKVRLSWYGKQSPDIRAGHLVELVVKLKPPSSFMNPGGFDNERWLTQKGFVATGYVREKSFDASRAIVGNNPDIAAGLRNKLQRKLVKISHGMSSAGIVLALSVGDRSAIDRSQWDAFIATGTNHLLAISGLHISLVALFFGALASFVWRYTAMLSIMSRQQFALLCGALAALVYAAMAGFTVPTLRALLMYCVLVCMSVSHRHTRRSTGLTIAFIAITLIDPLSVLAPSFWMSFAAVAVVYLVFTSTRSKTFNAKVFSAIRGHFLICVGLYPLTMLFFQQASIISPLANFLVTPLVGVLITPLVFLASLIALIHEGAAVVVLHVVDFLLQAVFWLIAYLAQLPLALMEFGAMTWTALLLLTLFAMNWVLSLSWTIRLISLLLLLPLFSYRADLLDEGDYRVTFLDVGQGTSVVVRTREHTLLYDTGDQFSTNFSAANAVVLPYLRNQNIRSIDAMIVSHADRDHSGGADELIAEYSFATIYGSAQIPQSPEQPLTLCAAGMSWVWDQVVFEFLHPSSDFNGSKNDGSCVLQISTPGNLRTLLPGDIEKQTESFLVGSDVMQPVVLLMSPHHGSATSSTEALIRRLQPNFVVHTAGFQNRFKFPAKEVVARYQSFDVQQLTTSESGAIDFLLSDDKAVKAVEYRQEKRRWWYR